jgi:hypothetical protein
MRSPAQFFASEYCISERACIMCRDRMRGATWRQRIADVAEDVKSPDFECPKGKPWDFNAPAPDMTYDAVVRAIADAPNEGVWMNLKEQVRSTEAFIAANARSNPTPGMAGSPCWTRRQKNRIIMFYQTAMKKAKEAKTP